MSTVCVQTESKKCRSCEDQSIWRTSIQHGSLHKWIWNRIESEKLFPHLQQLSHWHRKYKDVKREDCLLISFWKALAWDEANSRRQQGSSETTGKAGHKWSPHQRGLFRFPRAQYHSRERRKCPLQLHTPSTRTETGDETKNQSCHQFQPKRPEEGWDGGEQW